MALLGIDERFVQALEHVGLHVGEAEGAHLEDEALDHLRAAVGLERPVEEVGFGDAQQSGLLERLPGEQVGRRGVGQAEHLGGHRLGEGGEVGVLEEEVVVVYG